MRNQPPPPLLSPPPPMLIGNPGPGMFVESAGFLDAATATDCVNGFSSYEEAAFAQVENIQREMIKTEARGIKLRFVTILFFTKLCTCNSICEAVLLCVYI